ncbi:MAG: DUF2851 family protein [Bacteroidales bacterium]|nr:DUF2851 family protein [Bacteroidales bacterium]
MQETWLHQIWGNRLYESLTFEPHPCIPEGVTPIVIDPGRYNTNGGPDFSNLKLRIGSLTWAGNGEIHCHATDWLHHGHQLDPAYNNVLLHIVLQDDGPISLQAGTPPITCRMQINPDLLAIAQQLTEAPQIPRCGEACSQLSEEVQADWFAQLTRERLDKKCQQIEAAMSFFKGDLAAVTHLFLMRYLGGKVNNDAFEQIARQLSPSILLKHKTSPLALEALLLGMGGLLESDPISPEVDQYREQLGEEFTFLAHKYHLSPLAPGTIRMLRLRPSAFPHRRLAYLAALYYRSDNLPGELLRTSSLAHLEQLLTVTPTDYWQRHYHWGNETDAQLGTIGRATIESIAINVVIPLQYYLTQERDLLGLSLASDSLMSAHDLPAERNSVVRRFVHEGLRPRSAYDTQALLQLYGSYCEPRRCWLCPVGRTLLQSYGAMTLPPSVGESQEERK